VLLGQTPLITASPRTIQLKKAIKKRRTELLPIKVGLDWFIVLNATFNNISVTLWRSVLLVEETGVPRENHRPVVSH
jgi:hypothetical protein